MRSAPHELGTAWFALQALLVLAWWLWLAIEPAARRRFAIDGWPEGVLLAFAAPDALLLVAGGFAASWLRRRRARGADACAFVVAGASLYAAVWCLAASLVHGSGWLATAAMLPHALLCGWSALQRPAHTVEASR